MALKSPWTKLLGLTLVGAAGFYIHSRVVESAYYAGKRSALAQSAGSVALLLKEITTVTKDIDGDGLEDFCLIFPPEDAVQQSKAVCRMDYDGDCIPDTIYAVINSKGKLEIVNSQPGKRSEGKCGVQDSYQLLRQPSP